MKSIYEPAQDSFLLSEVILGYLKNIDDNKIKIIDMGTGSGLQALTCKKSGFKNIVGADINKEAVKNLKKNKIKGVYSNLFSKIPKKDKYDLIIFNPPYLPEDIYDNEVDTTAGKNGYELILKFLKQSKSHLDKSGAILLLFSSQSKPKIILKTAKELGYKYELIVQKRLFFEELFVYKFYIKQTR